MVTVVRLDGLGRSLADLMVTVKEFQKAGVGFRSLKEAINTETAGGKLVFHIFGSIAEFERDLIRDRVQAGLVAARARGRHGGRPRQDHSHREQLAASMLADPCNTVADVCRALKCSRAHTYRLAARGRAVQGQQPLAIPTPEASPGKPIRAGKPTDKAQAKAERGVPPQAAAVRGRKAASSPRKTTRTSASKR